MSTDPQIRDFEKRIAQDARTDQKNLDHVVKDLKNAEKAHQKAIKGADNAQHQLDKAVQQEHKTAGAVEKAEHNHQAAIQAEASAEKRLDLARQYQERLEQELQKRRGSVDEWEHRKDVNDQQREMKLADIHNDAASRAGSRANSVNYGLKNGARNPGAAAGVNGAQGPTAPGVGMGPSGAAA
ncbi:uncharacterized protein PHACADRAFT_191806 [Phanerochaete carnosa HHB-10118-sp]|uniref:Uncharacterized protein n=1 Tax=Phanerochaete carnosa (strain HHB-10118-sp) TaxID=650164 RepID=K5W6A1_PHACS|nr:uncharacterized protein PHACADRAFT_191806 [Phanerochaete carnosa HHB-10118-sp]EKM59448.1 hypothetical protein PHACADRAFT_191806 [Phanerochaete carnosa HHB-10118-sp]